MLLSTATRLEAALGPHERNTLSRYERTASSVMGVFLGSMSMTTGFFLFLFPNMMLLLGTRGRSDATPLRPG
ncbi:hypothetical protein C5C20_01085 [Rathayibacter rathayi]|nr:hypothetical protein C5C14_01080 [Rathayibacter rathayi]PPG16149.1 hypothetical protein C5C11_00365 [Rathayibacter rathayi]PPG47403.1 hypothetical protein C5C20_01085 [Rathayibacter rathayi]PPI04968.1 hypothetical protein C5C43_01085 [Rathayibacter rathayi]PPI12220.1 hypothetical protein C5D23_01085 [Rathayibacter rathayi]